MNYRPILRRSRDLHQGARATRYCARDQQGIGRCIDLHDAEILDGDAVIAHASAHAHVLGDFCARATAAGE